MRLPRSLRPVLAFCAIQVLMGAGIHSLPVAENAAGTEPETFRSSYVIPSAADDQIFNDGASVTVVSNSLVEGGLSVGSTDGGGNLDADPELLDSDGIDNIPGSVDDDVSIQATSPAVNAGNDASLPSDKFDLDGDGDTSEPVPTDIAGDNRFFNPSGGGNAVDMGAYENAADNIASEGRPDRPSLPLLFELPYPNPVTSSAELSFRLPASERVQIAVFDAIGRQQKVLYSDVVQPGREYRLTVPADDLASGVYFVRLRSASFDESRKIVVVR